MTFKYFNKKNKNLTTVLIYDVRTNWEYKKSLYCNYILIKFINIYEYRMFKLREDNGPQSLPPTVSILEKIITYFLLRNIFLNTKEAFGKLIATRNVMLKRSSLSLFTSCMLFHCTLCSSVYSIWSLKLFDSITFYIIKWSKLKYIITNLF